MKRQYRRMVDPRSPSWIIDRPFVWVTLAVIAVTITVLGIVRDLPWLAITAGTLLILFPLIYALAGNNKVTVALTETGIEFLTRDGRVIDCVPFEDLRRVDMIEGGTLQLTVQTGHVEELKAIPNDLAGFVECWAYLIELWKAPAPERATLIARGPAKAKRLPSHAGLDAESDFIDPQAVALGGYDFPSNARAVLGVGLALCGPLVAGWLGWMTPRTPLVMTIHLLVVAYGLYLVALARKRRIEAIFFDERVMVVDEGSAMSLSYNQVAIYYAWGWSTLKIAGRPDFRFFSIWPSKDLRLLKSLRDFVLQR